MEKVDPLDEMLQFLKPNSRIDLKQISIDNLLNLSGSEEGIRVLLKNEQVIQCIIDLTDDKVEDVSKNALRILVNITANARGASELLKYKPFKKENIVELLISYVMNSQKKLADAACMTLSNITRLENSVTLCLDTFLPHLNNLVNLFVNVNFNEKGSNLNYLSQVFSNLSRSPRIIKWLTEENPHVPLIKIIPFCNYQHSEVRRLGAIGIVKNISLDTSYHEFLLSNDLDLLTYLMAPLMGNEEYPDDEMDKLPITLQYLPKNKRRDISKQVRRTIIETFNLLCAKSHGRKILRDNGLYYVLREYHKWEMDPNLVLACEKVIDILILKEEEVGVEDLLSVEVPDELKEKFQKMDEEYVNNMQD